MKGLFGCLSFSGRANRSEFWQFFPLGITLPLAALACAFLLDASMVVAVLVFGLFGLPLAAVGARRLLDTGEYGLDAVTPWALFMMATICGDWSVRSLSNLNWAFAQPEPPDGPGGLGFVVIFGIGGALLGAICLLLLIMFLVRITPAFGQTLVPSQPGPNTYGPNPNEVPQ